MKINQRVSFSEPHFWQRDAEGTWNLIPVVDPWFLVDTLENAVAPVAGRPLLKRVAGSGAERWCIVAESGQNLRVNGEGVETGIRVLDHRDAVQVGHGDIVFFATDFRAAIAPFPGADHEVICPRCKTPIESGMSAVTCPQCRVAHHQIEEGPKPRPCFTYNHTCARCSHPTDLSLDTRWHPEEL